MADYKITFYGDTQVSNVHHIGVECSNGNYYSVIFGEYVNGGFCSIPNWKVGCELSTFDDVFYSTEKISNALKNNKDGKQIALAIADYAKRKKLV